MKTVREKWSRFSFDLPPELRKDFKKLAGAKGKSMGEYMRNIIAQALVNERVVVKRIIKQ